MIVAPHRHGALGGLDRDLLHRQRHLLGADLVAGLAFQGLQGLPKTPDGVYHACLHVDRVCTRLSLEILSEGCALVAVGVGEVGLHGEVAQRRVAGGGDVAGLVERRGEEAPFESGIRGGLQQQQQVVAPVARDDRIGAPRPDLGYVGREVLDLVDVMEHVSHDRVAVLLGVVAREALEVLTPAVVLPDEIDLLAQGARLLRGRHQRPEPAYRALLSQRK